MLAEKIMEFASKTVYEYMDYQTSICRLRAISAIILTLVLCIGMVVALW